MCGDTSCEQKKLRANFWANFLSAIVGIGPTWANFNGFSFLVRTILTLALKPEKL
jgi:hypothetical protein